MKSRTGFLKLIVLHLLYKFTYVFTEQLNIDRKFCTILNIGTMKQFTLLTIIIIMFLISCNPDNDILLTPETQPNYFTFKGQVGAIDNSTLASLDNNLIVCGNNDNNLFILKITKQGKQIWRNDFSAGYNSYASGISEVNGNIFICGSSTKELSGSNSDVLLIKINSSGDTIWTRTYGGVDADYGKNIISTSDGNLLIAGKTESFGAGTFGDIYLLKLNTDGEILWTMSYPDQDQEVPFHLFETKNGEYLVTGTNEDNNQYRELYLLKISSAGQLVWNKKIGPPTWKWGYSTIEIQSGDLLTCGKHTSNGFNKVLAVKTNSQGKVIWEKEFGINNLSEEGCSIKQNYDGTFTIAGRSFDQSTGLTDLILLKIDQNGDLVWRKIIEKLSFQSGINLIKDSNDGNIITGSYNDNAIMIRVDSNGIFK